MGSRPPERADVGDHAKWVMESASEILFPADPAVVAVTVTALPFTAEVTPTYAPQFAVLIRALRRVASVPVVELDVKLPVRGFPVDVHTLVAPELTALN